jgi:hypothetical protein
VPTKAVGCGRGGTCFRLIATGLVGDPAADPPTLSLRELDRPRQIEHAMDQIRAKFGIGRCGATVTSRPATP